MRFFYLPVLLSFLTGCAAMRGQSTYDGTGKYLRLAVYTRVYATPSGHQYQRVAQVDNPLDTAVSIRLICTVSEYPDLTVPPHTSQSILLGANDDACAIRGYRVVR